MWYIYLTSRCYIATPFELRFKTATLIMNQREYRTDKRFSASYFWSVTLPLLCMAQWSTQAVTRVRQSWRWIWWYHLFDRVLCLIFLFYLVFLLVWESFVDILCLDLFSVVLYREFSSFKRIFKTPIYPPLVDIL